MTQEDYERIKNDPAMLDMLIRQHCETVAAEQAKSKSKADSKAVNTSPAMVEERPLAVENKMEAGSMRLGAAIDIMLAGGNPETPPVLMWTSGTSYGTKHRELEAHRRDETAVYVDRQPCGRCGVRFDKHKDYGCKVYARGVAA